MVAESWESIEALRAPRKLHVAHAVSFSGLTEPAETPPVAGGVRTTCRRQRRAGAGAMWPGPHRSSAQS